MKVHHPKGTTIFPYDFKAGHFLTIPWGVLSFPSQKNKHLASTIPDATQASEKSNGGFAVVEADNAMFMTENNGNSAGKLMPQARHHLQANNKGLATAAGFFS